MVFSRVLLPAPHPTYEIDKFAAVQLKIGLMQHNLLVAADFYLSVIYELLSFHVDVLFFVAAFQFPGQIFHAQPFGGKQHDKMVYEV